MVVRKQRQRRGRFAKGLARFASASAMSGRSRTWSASARKAYSAAFTRLPALARSSSEVQENKAFIARMKLLRPSATAAQLTAAQNRWMRVQASSSISLDVA